MPKLRNIIIFIAIAAVFVLIYIFFIRTPPSDDGALVSSSASPLAAGAAAAGADSAVAQEFLALLLSVRNIKLNDAILSDISFTSLDGSHSIVLTPDGNEGRPNPFAPLGSDSVSTLSEVPAAPASLPASSSLPPTTPATPPVTTTPPPAAATTSSKTTTTTTTTTAPVTPQP